MLRKIFSTMGSRLVMAIASFLIIIVVSKFLGANGRGEASLILATIALILIFTNIIGGASLVYLSPRHNVKKLAFISYAWATLVCFTSYFTLYLLEDVIGVNTTYFHHISCLSFLNAILNINLNILIGKEKINRNNFINAIQPIISLVFLLIMFMSLDKLHIQQYLYALYSAYTFATGLSLISIIPFFNKGDERFIDLFKACFKLGILNQATHIISFINMRLSFYMLNNIIDQKSVGIYSNAIALIESSWIITRSIAMVQFSKIANTKDDQKSQLLTLKLSKLSILMSLGLLVPMSLLPPIFYETIFFGKEFGEINRLILIMLPSIVLYNYYLIMGHYFSGTGNYRIGVYGAGTGMIITLFSAYPLILNYGLNGASITTSLSTFSAAMVVLFFFLKTSKLGLKDLLITRDDLKFKL